MSSRLLLQNAVAYDEMVFTLPGGALDTTVTTSDLTLQFTKAGVAYTTTGISLAANTYNGTWNITFDTTSFVTSNGAYHMLVIHSTKDYHKYIGHYDVAAAQAYTAVAASFTASAGDGRITDGTNPIDGATVYVKLADGTIITQKESDSNGLYGTIYGLTQNATLYAQKSGYDQGTGTITVSGLTATGPGADITLSSSTASDFLVSNLLTYCRRMAGGDMTGDRADSIFLRCINNAANMTAMDSNSEYYHDFSAVDITGGYSTGQLSASQDNSILTIQSGTWPSWAASGFIKSNNRLYRAESVSSNDLTTSANWIDSTQTVANGSWSLERPCYSMPNDWLRTRYVIFGKTTINGYQDACGFTSFAQRMYQDPITSTIPEDWCVADNKLWLYPIPAERNFVELIGTRRPTQVVNASETLDCCHTLKNLLYRAIDMQLCISFGHIEGGRNIQQTLEAYQMELFLHSRNDKDGPVIQPPSFARPHEFGISVAMHNSAPDPT